VSVSDEEGQTNAFVFFFVDVTGDIIIQATQEKKTVDTTKFFGIVPATISGVGASAGTESTSTGDILADGQSAVTAGIMDFVTSKFTKPKSDEAQADDKTKGNIKSFDVAAAVVVAGDINNVSARIGDGNSGNVEADGAITIKAIINNRQDVTAGSDAKAGSPDASGDSAKFGGSAAVIIASMDNNARAYIAADAEVDAGQTLTVQS
ncbi:MAG: hypothetical protein GY869_14480, partial [Planctomycetes bacterium]|nr:hypothetical protein [Planctomycetota bacterium]